jgi:hypothetical protein
MNNMRKRKSLVYIFLKDRPSNRQILFVFLLTYRGEQEEEKRKLTVCMYYVYDEKK